MISRFEKFSLYPDSWAEYEIEWKKTAVLRRLTDGLKGRLLVRSFERPDEGFGLSLWESLATLTDFEQRLKPSLEKFYVGEVAHSRGEVRYLHFDEMEHPYSASRW